MRLLRLTPRIVVPMIFASLLVACGSAPPEPSAASTSTGDGGTPPVQPVPRSPEALLRSAERAYAEAQDMAGLEYVLATLDVNALSSADAWRYEVLTARLALARGDFAAADQALAKVPDARYASAFDQQELVSMARLRAEIHDAADRPLAAARERVYLHGLLTDEALRRANREAIWRNLTTLDSTDIAAALRDARGQAELRGWLELAAIARGMFPTLEAQQREVELWQRRWQRRWQCHRRAARHSS